MSQSTAVLDIGSTKVICLICSPDHRGGILVHGAGIHEYDGYKEGEFLSEQKLGDAVTDAVAVAEGEAKTRIRDLSVGVPAAFSKLVLSQGSAAVENRKGKIDRRTVDELIGNSLNFETPDGYAPMHSTPLEFQINDAKFREVPLGHPAERLDATVSHLFVAESFRTVICKVLERTGLEPDLYISVPLSEAMFIIPKEEREDCAVLIDVGGKQTDISLIRGSALIAMETLPLGGSHFASDLAYGLNLPVQAGESVKRRYVYSLDDQDSIDTIRTPDGAMAVEHSVIQYIIEARTKELGSMILTSLQGMGVRIHGSLPVYLTGGGVSLMRGSCECLEKLTGLNIKVRMPWMPRLSSPNYASAFSVINFVMHMEDDESIVPAALTGGLWKQLLDFFR